MSAHVERRRSPRVTAAGHPNLPSSLIDVSLGGFSMALPAELPTGSIQNIGLALGADQAITLQVRVAYCHEEAGPDGPVWVTGLTFLRDVTGRTALALAS